MITFDLRQHDFHQELGTQARLCWRKASYHVDVHELSPFHNPMTYRFIMAQGFSLDSQNQRRPFTPEIQGVSTAQHMSHSVIRLACYLAVVCGVSLIGANPLLHACVVSANLLHGFDHVNLQKGVRKVFPLTSQ